VLTAFLVVLPAGVLLAKTTTWTNAAPGDNNWSTAGNWDNGVPVDFDDVLFSSVSGTSNHDIPGLILGDIDMTGFNGTLSIPYGLTLNGDLVVDGTLDAGGGGINSAGSIVVVGFLDLTGGDIDAFGSISVSGELLATSGTISAGGNLDVDGTLTADGMSSIITIGDLLGDTGCDIDVSFGVVDVGGSVFVQGDLDATGSTITTAADMEVGGTLHADGSAIAVEYDFSGGTGAVMHLDSGQIVVGGSVWLANVASTTWTTGRLIMGGLGGPRSIQIGPTSNVLYELEISSGSATDMIDLVSTDSTVTVTTLTVHRGTLELGAVAVTIGDANIDLNGTLNGKYEDTQLDLTGNLTIRGTFSYKKPKFKARIAAGSTVDVTSGGTFEVIGSASNRSILQQDGIAGGTQWILFYDATSTITVDYAEVQDSDAQGPAPVVATNSLDKGNNTNWDFGLKVTSWTNADPGNDLWSTPGNWDNGVPNNDDRVYFDPVSGTSSQDIPGLVLEEIDMSGYAGTLTIPHGLTVSTDLTVDGKVVGSGVNIDVGGNMTVLGELDASNCTITIAGSVGVDSILTADGGSVFSIVMGSLSGGAGSEVGLTNSTVAVAGDIVIGGDLHATGSSIIGGGDVQVGDTLWADGSAIEVENDFSGGTGAVMDLGSAQIRVGGSVWLANVASAAWTTGGLTMDGLGGSRSIALGPNSNVLNELVISSASADDLIDLESTDSTVTVTTLTVDRGTLELGPVTVTIGDANVELDGALKGKYEGTTLDLTGTLTVRSTFSYTRPKFKLRFAAGATVDVTGGGTFEVIGSATKRSRLMQDLAPGGAQWIMLYDATSTITVDYAEVQDSDAQGPYPVVATNSYDMGNNTNWDFLPVGIRGQMPLHLSVSASPNPFNPSTTIRYEVPNAGPVSLKIFDAAGRLVRTIVSGQQSPGRYQSVWRGFNDAGQPVSSGVYFCRLHSVDGSRIQKLVLLK
jgi:hypothetical protein